MSAPTPARRPRGAAALVSAPVASEHLFEDTMNSACAQVTLSTFFDGTVRATRSMLVAHTSPTDASPTSAGEDDADAERVVLASFELDRRGGSPKAGAVEKMHRTNAALVAHLLDGEDPETVENGDLIVAVLEAAAYFRDAARA